MFSVIGIRGLSMAPTLQDGDIVIALDSRFQLFGPVAGDVVIVDHPHLGLIVKRLQEVSVQSRTCRLVGDSGLSTNAQILGDVPLRHVLARALIRLPGKGFPRWLGRRKASVNGICAKDTELSKQAG